VYPLSHSDRSINPPHKQGENRLRLKASWVLVSHSGIQRCRPRALYTTSKTGETPGVLVGEFTQKRSIIKTCDWFHSNAQGQDGGAGLRLVPYRYHAVLKINRVLYSLPNFVSSFLRSIDRGWIPSSGLLPDLGT